MNVGEIGRWGVQSAAVAQGLGNRGPLVGRARGMGPRFGVDEDNRTQKEPRTRGNPLKP
jgi:hypothetical protein